MNQEDVKHSVGITVKLSGMTPYSWISLDNLYDQMAARFNRGELDPAREPREYLFLEDPGDKDFRRIFDIVNKANAQYGPFLQDGENTAPGLLTSNDAVVKMTALARQMNNAIRDEAKRARRRNACLQYGLKFLADCFR